MLTTSDPDIAKNQEKPDKISFIIARSAPAETKLATTCQVISSFGEKADLDFYTVIVNFVSEIDGKVLLETPFDVRRSADVIVHHYI